MTSPRKLSTEPSFQDARRGTAMELLMAGAELSQVLERTVRRRSGLSLHQFNVLRVLEAREPDSTFATDLTRALGMSSAHATTVLQQLEDRNLVQRHENPDDRRRRLVRVTDDGKGALERALPALEQLEQGVTSALGTDDESAELKAELRSIRIALRQALAAEDWEDCAGP